MTDELPFGTDYQELCHNCGREDTNLNLWGVCPACDLELMQEMAEQQQEDIDEYNSQRMSGCASSWADHLANHLRGQS